MANKGNQSLKMEKKENSFLSLCLVGEKYVMKESVRNTIIEVYSCTWLGECVCI